MRPTNLSSASPLLPDSSGGQHLPLPLLRQYVAGALPAAAQQRVEAHTLVCTRCADVLDGLSQTNLATTDQSLAELQARLRARVAEEKPDQAPAVPLWQKWQLVAAVLLLLVSAVVWLGIRRPSDQPNTGLLTVRRQAANQPTAPRPLRRPAAVAPATPNAPAETTLADNAVVSAPTPQAFKKAPLKQPPYTAPTRNKLVAATSAPAKPSVVLADADAVVASAASPSSTETAATAKSDPRELDQNIGTPESKEAYSKARVASSPQPTRALLAAPDKALNGQIALAAPALAGRRVVRGRVIDRTSGTGLPGVTVLAKGTTTGVSTAADGSFALIVPESVQVLTFSSIGYNTSEQILPADSSLVLAQVLAPDNRQLSEVVVVRRESPPAPPSVEALPAGGLKEFREYLKRELQYPEQALKDGKEGTVRLRFTVATDGSLQAIKVVRGLSTECDAEAIRLLKEGPKWYPAILKGRRTARSVDISVPFKLND